MMHIFLLQLFWFSFALIGLGVALLYRKWLICRRKQALLKTLAAFDTGVSIFALFCVGIATMLVVVVPGYLLQWSLTVVEAWYIALLVCSVLLCIQERVWLRRAARLRLARLTRRQWYLGCGVLTLLVLEYIAAYHAGVSLEDDTPIHLDHIQLMINDGRLNFTDPFMGYNGLIDLRYSTNIMNGLQAMAGHMLHMAGDRVWLYSAAFYRLVLAGGFYSLARVFLPKQAPSLWTYVVLLVVPIMNNDYFFEYPELPHVIVLAWTVLLFIGLKLLLERSYYAVFAVAILLIAATHSITSAGVCIFLAILSAVLIMRRSVSRQQITVMTIAGLILLAPVAANLLTPSHSSGASVLQETSVHGLHEVRLETTTHGWLVWPKITVLQTDALHATSRLLDAKAWLVYGVVAAYAYMFRGVERPKLKRLLLYMLGIAGLLVFNSLILSTATYIYLVRKTPAPQTKILLIVAVIFYALLAYDPVTLSLFFGRVPLWVVARFQDISPFAFIAPILSVFILYAMIARSWRLPKLGTGYALVVLIVIANQFVTRLSINTRSVYSFGSTAYKQTKEDYENTDGLRPLDSYVKNKVIFTNATAVQYRMAVATQGWVGIIYNNQSAQMQNLPQRDACNTRLLDNLSQSDLLAAHVQEVVLLTPSRNSSDIDARKLLSIASRANYLQSQAVVGQYHIYKVLANGVPTDLRTPCAIPYGQ